MCGQQAKHGILPVNLLIYTKLSKPKYLFESKTLNVFIIGYSNKELQI